MKLSWVKLEDKSGRPIGIYASETEDGAKATIAAFRPVYYDLVIDRNERGGTRLELYRFESEEELEAGDFSRVVAVDLDSNPKESKKFLQKISAATTEDLEKFLENYK